ncbi:MAG: tetratricopeptide repeat protein [Candidatus Acidiferrales bacterium]
MKTLLCILAISAIGALPAAGGVAAQTPAPPPQETQKPQTPPPDLSDAYYYFSVGHLNEQQFEITGDTERANQAIDDYKKALEITPNSTVVMERLAEIYAKSQRIREAVVEAQAVLKLDPDNVDAHKLLARIYVRTLGDVSAGDVQKENLAKAVEQFQAILKIEPDDLYSALWLARLYRFENQHADAEKVLRGVLQRDADNGPALEQLSQILIDEGRSQEAIQLLSDAANDSASPDVYDLLGDAYSQAHESAKAEDAYRKAIAEDPDDPGHLHGLAQALMAQDKYAEALEVFKKLTEIEPTTGENFLRMAELYRRLGKFDQAEAALLRAKQLTQGSLEVLWNEALLYEDEGRYDDAIKVLSDAIGGVRGQSSSDANPNALSVLYEQLGHAYRLAGNDPLAIRAYEDMAKLSPESEKRAQMLLIDTYRENRDIDKAIAETKKALDASPKDAGLTVQLAMLYGEKLDAAAATTLLQGLLRGDESDEEVYLDLAQVLERCKNYPEAEQAAQKALGMAKDPAVKESAWFMLGAIYERQKKWDLAEAEFKKALAANPTNAAVLNYYGYMLADRGVRLDEATSMIQRAVQQDPNNGAYLDSLGWVYYKQNKLTEAEENLRKAVEHQMHDPTILAHLGDVYAKMGQKDRAVDLWERSLVEWQKSVPADYEADKVNELDAQVKAVKRHTAQKTSPDAPKPQ